MPISCLQSLLAAVSNKRIQFTNAIFDSNLKLAQQLAFDLYKKDPHYLLFYYTFTLKSSKKLLLKMLSTTKQLDPHLIYTLLKSPDFTYSELQPFEEKVTSSTFIGLCLKKQFFLKKYTDFKDNTTDIKLVLNNLIKIIDDFNLYDFALKNDIEIDEHPSINYLWYKLLKYKSPEAGCEIILSSINFQDIKRVLDNVEINETGNRIYDILIQFIKGKDPNILLADSFDFLIKDTSFFALKVLLALLISTKNEKLLILALFISQNDKFEENFEISLINLFLCRYFLLFAMIRRKLDNLEIKNAQLHNFAFLWSDPMIIAKVKLHDETEAVKLEVQKSTSNFRNNFNTLIGAGQIAMALSAVELTESFKTSIILKEIECKEIFSTSKYTMFSDFLGEKCNFLFDKITEKDVRIKTGTIPSIRTFPEEKFNQNLFENDFMKISENTFISQISKVLSNQK